MKIIFTDGSFIETNNDTIQFQNPVDIKYRKPLEYYLDGDKPLVQHEYHYNKLLNKPVKDFVCLNIRGLKCKINKNLLQKFKYFEAYVNRWDYNNILDITYEKFINMLNWIVFNDKTFYYNTIYKQLDYFDYQYAPPKINVIDKKQPLIRDNTFDYVTSPMGAISQLLSNDKYEQWKQSNPLIDFPIYPNTMNILIEIPYNNVMIVPHSCNIIYGITIVFNKKYPIDYIASFLDIMFICNVGLLHIPGFMLVTNIINETDHITMKIPRLPMFALYNYVFEIREWEKFDVDKVYIHGEIIDRHDEFNEEIYSNKKYSIQWNEYKQFDGSTTALPIKKIYVYAYDDNNQIQPIESLNIRIHGVDILNMNGKTLQYFNNSLIYSYTFKIPCINQNVDIDVVTPHKTNIIIEYENRLIFSEHCISLKYTS